MLGREGSRADDNVETLKVRIQGFKEETTPVLDMYNRFGKVTYVSGEAEVDDVYAGTRKAIFPQVSFLVGPQGSGKTVLGKKVCERTNMSLINFTNFVAENNL